MADHNEEKSSDPIEIASLIDSSSLLSLTEFKQAGVPLMITRTQRERLAILGHTEAAVSQMTPAEAHAILDRE